MDVCSKDEFLEAKVNELSKDEGFMEFFQRKYESMVQSICSPERFEYKSESLSQFPNSSDYQVIEFNMMSKDESVKCCLWENKSPLSKESPLCFVYIHTNTRSMLDALELINLVHAVNGNLISMDLPGCGKSDGRLVGTNEMEIKQLLDWGKCLISPHVRFILWGRGLATASIVKLCAMASSKEEEPMLQSCIASAVLDSPFTGIEQMVDDGLQSNDIKGFRIPDTVMRVCTKMMLRSFSSRLDNLDLFSVRPIDVVSKCRLPCLILSAEDDDYIPSSHGKEIAAKWGGVKKMSKVVQYETFKGRHFGERPDALICGKTVKKFVITHRQPPVLSSSGKLSSSSGDVAENDNPNDPYNQSSSSSPSSPPVKERNSIREQIQSQFSSVSSISGKFSSFNWTSQKKEKEHEKK